ncbi:MAG: RNA polymerase factor sigma-54 [Bacteroidota bacterium]
MQKLRLSHTLSQRLSPQKLQLIKLLQVPSVAMQSRIEQELASNPALEEATDTPEELATYEAATEEEGWVEGSADNYQPAHAGSKQRQEVAATREANLSTPDTLGEQLLKQLRLLQLDERQHKIGVHLIGSIDADGYLRQDLEAIVNELAFTQYMEIQVQEVEAVLKQIQSFDPPGIGARGLQECLLIQLNKHPHRRAAHQLATQILTQCFEAFTKKHYEKITEKLAIENPTLLKEALELITRLDPKPGSSLHAAAQSEVLYPDFIVTQQNGQLQVALSKYRVPALRTRKSYVAMLDNDQKRNKQDKRLKEAATFAKKKLEAAQWFMEAVKQRQHTLLNTMQAIVRLQHDFFMEEEAHNLKPMVLKEVAEEIGMDVSTVSRIVSNKSVQTDLGVYPLKFFFTEAISTASGGEVSNRAVKEAIEEIIQQENKQQPYADEKIAALLKEKGYPVARRTVAKYREQLHLPVARLRKAL